ncbi:MAG TPA: hypothetical protein VFD10_08035 [Atribacterota bacterium]|nr:hypothetical protein [Atribacterota bacterium]
MILLIPASTLNEMRNKDSEGFFVGIGTEFENLCDAVLQVEENCDDPVTTVKSTHNRKTINQIIENTEKERNVYFVHTRGQKEFANNIIIMIYNELYSDF